MENKRKIEEEENMIYNNKKLCLLNDKLDDKLDITRDINDVISKYGNKNKFDGDTIEKEILELLGVIKSTMGKKYIDKNINVIAFNEILVYKGENYDLFYNLYKKIYPDVPTSSSKFIKLVNKLEKDLKPIKKGNYCVTCLFPISYITKQSRKPWKVCLICRKLEKIKKYYKTDKNRYNKNIYKFVTQEIGVQDKTRIGRKVIKQKLDNIISSFV